jgi:DNA-directed RNA polymerase beta' subunit
VVCPKEWLPSSLSHFVIRKLIERGIVKTVKSAKKLVDRKDPVIWEILENILKGHPGTAEPGSNTSPFVDPGLPA